MGLMDIYNNAKNPIDDIDTISKLLKLYTKTDSNYYNKLVSASGTIDSRIYNPSYENDFIALIFNTWKKSIISMTRDEFIELYKNGEYKEDFVELRKYLLNIPDAKTKEEVEEILDKGRENKNLEHAIDNYCWTKIGEASGWTHIYSRYIHAKKEEYQSLDHRLYLNVDSRGIHKVCKLFIEECEKENIPYYFKYVLGHNRDDSIVFYSSTKYLEKQIEILKKIKEENKDLDGLFGKPPILTAQVTDWMGYGSEPVAKTEDGKKYSFNLVRAEIIEKSIDTMVANWIKEHRQMVINYKGKKIIFEDYIMTVATECFINKLNREYDSTKKNMMNQAKEKNQPIKEEEIENKCGYKKTDLSNPEVRKNIYKVFSGNKEEYMNAIIQNKIPELKPLTFTFRNNKKRLFYNYDFKNTLNAIVPQIAKFDEKLLESIQTNIKELSVRYGIDPRNFSFDVKRVEDMRAYDKYVASQNQVKENKQELEEMLKKEVIKPRERGINETDEEYEKYLKEFYGSGNGDKK